MGKDSETLADLAPIFQEVLDLVAEGRGHRGTLWKTTHHVEDIASILRVKADRLCLPNRKEDDARDAVAYAAMLLWRIRHG